MNKKAFAGFGSYTQGTNLRAWLCRIETNAFFSGSPDQGLADALKRLPSQLAATVYLADAQGYKYTEIAEITEVPLGTVMSRLHRARRRLRDLLADNALSAEALSSS